MKKINNYGFTLVELLAVIVILVTILMIAVPRITSSMERSKTKQLEQKQNLLVSFANIYLSDYKNSITTEGSCYIELEQLKSVGVVDADLVDADGNDIIGCIVYNVDNKTLVFDSECNISDICLH